MFNNDTPRPFKNNDWSLGTVGTLTTAGGIFAAHKYFLKNSNTYAEKLYKYASTIEERSPGQILRTFGLSELFSSYVTPEQIVFTPEDLFKEGKATDIMSHMTRLTGGKIDLSKAHVEGLRFNRAKGEAYHVLESQPELSYRFARQGRITGASGRYGAPLNPEPLNTSFHSSFLENYEALKKSQIPRSYAGTRVRGGLEDLPIQPLFAKVEGETLNNFRSKWGRIGFEHLERPQRLLADFGIGGVGARAGSYNRMFHIPFVGEGRGLVNELLTKRVAPVALAITALSFADYFTNHAVSTTALDVLQKASVFRAEVTDRVPGLRSITDTYSKIVPGAQYAPLALPLGGAFAGSLVHYSKVVAGKYKDNVVRKAASNIFAREGEETFLKYFNKGPVGKGFAIGLIAAIPFIPGMLGSRKTADEQRRIYSGADPVPIRSGRWWELSSTPLEGARIKEWRPHWSVLFRHHTRDISMYGSEKKKWELSPFLHPLNYLADPYQLEKLNYEDRPYPITSPAFSDVPLIGPLLAATIGKIIKPVVRMHTDVNEDDYTLYTKRLEPKGPRVDSKLEADVLQELAKHGYKANTQVKEGNYRLDFVVGNEKNKLAIEADGVSYHGWWNADADAERQANIEKAGWDVARVNSTEFFADPEAAMQPIYNKLQAKGIKPQDTTGLDIHSGLIGLAPAKPKEEFGLWHTIKREAFIFSDFIGLPGFIGRSVNEKLFPNKDLGKEVFLEGSRQMDSLSRRYYDLELGAGYLPTAEGSSMFGYTEPIRRFIQPEPGINDVNEIPNKFANVSWIPGDDYLVNLQKGDPYSKISDGYARLPGAGFESLHPHLAGLDPEDYPDIDKLSILGDVAPYSLEYQRVKRSVGMQARDNIDLEIEYEKILDRVRITRESTINTDKRRFSGDIDTADGTISEADASGFTLKEYPGRLFKYSSVGSSAADLSALSLAENNKRTKEQVGSDVRYKQKQLSDLISTYLKPGSKVSVTIPKFALANDTTINAVVSSNGTTVNQQIFDEGLGVYSKSNAGPETQVLFGGVSKFIGKYAEEASFSGTEEWWNPNRYLPNPANTKLWQIREPIAQYREQEVNSGRIRRWEKPIKDFIAPYARGFVRRVTGETLIPEQTQEKRDLNTLGDMLKFLRAEYKIGEGNFKYTNQARSTAIGSDLFGSESYVASTLPDRDKQYFLRMVGENDPEKRKQILDIVPEQMNEALQAQWAKKKNLIELSEGKKSSRVGENGRQYSKEMLAAYKQANTSLDYGDYTRSVEIANFFARKGYDIPKADSTIWGEEIDYEDVKLKIIQEEGRDYHDFNFFDDRASLLWRKPYIDGAVRELTSGPADIDVERIRKTVEGVLIAAHDNNPSVVVMGSNSQKARSDIKINISLDHRDSDLKDMRRNPERYE